MYTACWQTFKGDRSILTTVSHFLGATHDSGVRPYWYFELPSTLLGLAAF